MTVTLCSNMEIEALSASYVFNVEKGLEDINNTIFFSLIITYPVKLMTASEYEIKSFNSEIPVT